MYQGVKMKRVLSVLFTFLMCFQLHSNNISWTTPPTVISGGTNAVDPQVSIDTNGNAVSVWTESNVVKASSKPISGSWSSAVTISGTGASSPRLVVDQSGNATAVWVEGGVIKAASKPISGSWSIRTSLSSTGASSPTICVDSTGDVIAAWARAGNIESSTKLFGASWQTKVTISSASATIPVIAIGGSGINTRAVLVWQGISGGNSVIFSSSKLISGTWATAQVISETTHNAARPYVAVDSNANALAIWYAYDMTGTSFTNVVVKSAARPISTGVWGGACHLSQPGIRDPSTLNARVAFDNVGNAMALWTISFDDETYNLESAVNSVNGEWSTPVDLVTSNVYAYSAELSATSFGDILSLYMFYNGNSLMIQSVESDMNGFLNNFWSVPITLSLGSNNAFPKIAASLSGNVIHAAAVWVNYNGVTNSVVASTGSKTLIAPATALTVTQSVHHFGAFDEYYNTLQWTASTSSNVVGYLIFRNGTFVQQVDASTLQFVDNNRVLNGSVTYSVTAIDDGQTQSATTSVNFP